MTLDEMERLVGYLRVSTSEQGDSGLGLAAQQQAIEAACAFRGVELVDVIQDVKSGAKTRDGLERAVAMCRAGEADGIIAAKLDRIFRSSVQFGRLLEAAKKEGWNIVVLDIGLDLKTPIGTFVASVMAAVAQLEREQTSQRTKDALAVAKTNGVRLGAAPRIDEELAERIRAMRRDGCTLWQIANRLNDEGVPTPAGGRQWQPSSFQRVLR